MASIQTYCFYNEHQVSASPDLFLLSENYLVKRVHGSQASHASQVQANVAHKGSDGNHANELSSRTLDAGAKFEG